MRGQREPPVAKGLAQHTGPRAVLSAWVVTGTVPTPVLWAGSHGSSYPAFPSSLELSALCWRGCGCPHPLPSPTSWGAAGTGSSPGLSASVPVLGQEPSPPLPCLATPQAPEPPLPCLAAPQAPEPVPLDTSVVEQSLMLAGQCLGPPRTARARGWARGSSALLCPGSAGSFAPGGLLWVCTLVLLTVRGSAWHRAVSRLLSHVMG